MGREGSQKDKEKTNLKTQTPLKRKERESKALEEKRQLATRKESGEGTQRKKRCQKKGACSDRA